MSIDLGYMLRKQVEGKPEVFHGEINHSEYTGEFYLIPVTEKRTDNSPDFVVKVFLGGWQERGAAWLKPMRTGGKYFSLSIDGPEFGQRFYLSGFPDDEQPKDTPKGAPVVYSLKWSRPDASKRSAPVTPATGGGRDGMPVDDEIPF